MLKRLERMMNVYSPAEEYGSTGNLIGQFPLSFSFRTAEEVESGGVMYTNLRVTALSMADRSPDGGYRRGMTIEDENGCERYHVLVPVRVGRIWILKLERVMENGDGEGA